MLVLSPCNLHNDLLGVAQQPFIDNLFWSFQFYSGQSLDERPRFL